ncbi:MAG: glutathione S-transferase family protein [Chroococcales cyanobacterium]
MTPVVELYSANVCPFAHRTRLTLLEKGVEFQLTEIDLNHKPDWFKNVSPYEKVPVIKHGENRVWESAIINEYLEEVFANPPLMPKDSGKRAIARIWIDFANTKFITAFYKILLIQDPEQQQKWKEELINSLLFMETEGLGKLSGDRRFWLKNCLSLVDLTFYPWFERWAVLEHYRGLSLPANCERLKDWWEAMSQRSSVQQIQQSPEFYIQAYSQYAQGTASGITAKEMKQA